MSLQNRVQQVPAVVALAVVLGCGAPAVPLDEARATVSLSEPARFYEAGAPVPLTLRAFNPGSQALALGEDLWDGRRLEVAAESGSILKTAARGDGPGGETLQPGQRVFRPLDLADRLPELAPPGAYLVTVAYPLFRSNTVRVHVIPAYQPGAAYLADVETDRGSFTLGFLPEVAPAHVRNFVNLARAGYYDNTMVHRIMPGVMFQAGDPTGTGRGSPGWTLKAEFSSLPHGPGTLSMARRSDDPDSAGAQWFICLDRVPGWDGQYTVFGKVVSGMDVAERIGQVPVKDEAPKEPVTIRRVTIRTAEPS